MIEGRLAEVEMLHADTNLCSETNLFEFHNNLSREEFNHGVMFSCAGYSFSLMWNEITQAVFLFDSRSKTNYGIKVSNST